MTRPFKPGDILQSVATGKFVVVTGVSETGFTWTFVENVLPEQSWDVADLLFERTNESSHD